MSYSKELDFGIKLAQESGKIMRDYFNRKDKNLAWKSDDTPITDADKKINQLVIRKVKTSFPDHGILGEEESLYENEDLIWVVDPIDGTAPFSLNMPVSTFSLALVDRRNGGQPVVGIAFDPYLNNMYTATKGQGTYLNGNRLKTSNASTFNKSYVSIQGGVFDSDKVDYQASAVMDKIRLMGARQFNIVSGVYLTVKIASGDFLLVSMGNGAPWDTAASALIVEEAGGIVTDLEGNQRRFDEFGQGCILAANKQIHELLLKMITV
jgi:fructose-1,6-bisphosphatase/inositol monophosphatase family enzyme